MTEKKGNLHGKILKGECEYVFFKEEELIALYKEKIDVKEWFKENAIHSENFSKFLIPFDSINDNLLIKKGNEIVSYVWREADKAVGVDRWQDRDDWTDFFNEKL